MTPIINSLLHLIKNVLLTIITVILSDLKGAYCDSPSICEKSYLSIISSFVDPISPWPYAAHVDAKIGKKLWEFFRRPFSL